MKRNQAIISCIIICTSLLLVVKDSFSKEKFDTNIAENILLYQRDNGGWPKNYDWKQKLNASDKKKLLNNKKNTDTTIDNGATHKEIKFLVKAYKKSDDKQYRDAAVRGIEFILKAQYDNGGWPQFYPQAKGYKKYITFNDGAMTGALNVLYDISIGKKEYTFVSRETKNRAETAVKKGIECILKCQIIVNGEKTAWCAQHDEKTFKPQKARSYELPSLSGSESVGIIEFLMRLDNPGREIVEAVQSGVAWFNKVKLTGIKKIKKEDRSKPEGWDYVVVKDASAPPMWARFYEIGTNKPIFCSRDGIPKRTLAEISYERRTGYSWLGYYASDMLAEKYPAWQKKWAR